MATVHVQGPVLEKTLQDMLPDDVHERANAGHVHVAVTALPWQPVLVNRCCSCACHVHVAPACL